jgi:hypothetical protein
MDEKIPIKPDLNEETEKHSAGIESLSPEHIAEKNFNKLIKWFQKQEGWGTSTLRGDIRSLQTPGGESFVSKSTRQEEFTYVSPDEKGERGGFREITTYTLTVGAQKRERIPFYSTNQSSYSGGKEFIVSSGVHVEAPKGTPEQIRDKLLAETRKKLEDIFERWEGYGLPSHTQETQPNPEDDDCYKARWSELQQNLQHEWDNEDTQFLAEKKRLWEEYENAAEELRKARNDVKEADRAAKERGVRDFELPLKPDYGNIGVDNIEEINRKTVVLHTYIEEINEYLATQAERLDGEAGKASTETGQSAETRRLWGIAESLAKIAEQKLGSATAKTLLQNVSTANYGRVRRQDSIRHAIGDLSGEAERFYELYRASDVNDVLNSTLNILEKVDKSEVSENSREISQQEVKEKELPHLKDADKKGWWAHELPNGFKHSEKLNKADKVIYDTGRRVDVHCPSCPGNPLVGYLQK